MKSSHVVVRWPMLCIEKKYQSLQWDLRSPHSLKATSCNTWTSMILSILKAFVRAKKSTCPGAGKKVRIKPLCWLFPPDHEHLGQPRASAPTSLTGCGNHWEWVRGVHWNSVPTTLGSLPGSAPSRPEERPGTWSLSSLLRSSPFAKCSIVYVLVS